MSSPVELSSGATVRAQTVTITNRSTTLKLNLPESMRQTSLATNSLPLHLSLLPGVAEESIPPVT